MMVRPLVLRMRETKSRMTDATLSSILNKYAFRGGRTEEGFALDPLLFPQIGIPPCDPCVLDWVSAPAIPDNKLATMRGTTP